METCDHRAVADSLTSRYCDWVHDALEDFPAAFLITDPAIAGHPIVFASRGFLSMSGYASEEVVGRNGRMFQGPGTSRRSVMEIREAIREERTLQISLLNYRRDGSPHWILFHLCPVFAPCDGHRRVVHFLSVQIPIPKRSRRSVVVTTTCRDAMRMDADLELDLANDDRGFEVEECREAGEWEKEKAASIAGEILSALARYGKLANGKRAGVVLPRPLSSALNISLGRIKQSFVLTDPHLPDMPIVYASDGFSSLTGYSRHEVLGRNCRFLNGAGTDTKVLNQIKDSIKAEKACAVRLLNYRKDRSPFWNLLHISSVRNASGKITFYVGVQIEEGSKSNDHGLSPEMRQLGTVGQVKVAVRSMSSGAGTSRFSS
ncbi:Non-specific serine/threonine protein kinase protein [Dioscorea alata]|uniref:Non-specific serine/threonine protein kinase protein n=1 Tax=Dioscorea alata TaxID=55571 RepID=A0ACB7UB29_DIOAL|nr:Non-specific serine/threonine protein kinase protein [Dioscorea alata]